MGEPRGWILVGGSGGSIPWPGSPVVARGSFSNSVEHVGDSGSGGSGSGGSGALTVRPPLSPSAVSSAPLSPTRTIYPLSLPRSIPRAAQRPRTNPWRSFDGSSGSSGSSWGETWAASPGTATSRDLGESGESGVSRDSGASRDSGESRKLERSRELGASRISVESDPAHTAPKCVVPTSDTNITKTETLPEIESPVSFSDSEVQQCLGPGAIVSSPRNVSRQPPKPVTVDTTAVSAAEASGSEIDTSQVDIRVVFEECWTLLRGLEDLRARRMQALEQVRVVATMAHETYGIPMPAIFGDTE